MSRFAEDFQKFITRGNVVDMAVGVIIGGAFGKIVTSLVNDVLMPPLGLLLGKADFTNLFISLSGRHYGSLSEAQAAGAPTLNYGLFINTIINFLIVSAVIFAIIRQMSKLDKPKPSVPAPVPATRECPFCISMVSVRASRCAHCAGDLPPVR